MATFVTFHQFILELGKGTHDLNGDTLTVALSNEAPVVATDATTTDMAPISDGGGYAATDIVNTYALDGNDGKISIGATDPLVFTGTTGFGPFRYVIIYNASKSNKLVCYWDYGSAISVGAGESFSIDWGTSLALIQHTS